MRQEPDLRGYAVSHPPGVVVVPQSESWDQVVHSATGAPVVDAPGSRWTIPPGRAAWIPAGTPHRLLLQSRCKLRIAYLRPPAALPPGRVRVVVVSALLRELLHHAVQAAPMCRDDTPSAAVLDLLSALVETAPTAAPLQLDVPRDERAAAVAGRLLEDPALDLTTACEAGAASRRTIERLFNQATGLSLGAWRQKTRVLRAVQLLADGHPLARVAHSVGYSSQSSFGVAFREHLGVSPARFVRDLGVPVPTGVPPTQRPDAWR